jgi:hypothetical protein
VYVIAGVADNLCLAPWVWAGTENEAARLELGIKTFSHDARPATVGLMSEMNN